MGLYSLSTIFFFSFFYRQCPPVISVHVGFPRGRTSSRQCFNMSFILKWMNPIARFRLVYGNQRWTGWFWSQFHARKVVSLKLDWHQRSYHTSWKWTNCQNVVNKFISHLMNLQAIHKQLGRTVLVRFTYDRINSINKLIFGAHSPLSIQNVLFCRWKSNSLESNPYSINSRLSPSNWMQSMELKSGQAWVHYEKEIVV